MYSLSLGNNKHGSPTLARQAKDEHYTRRDRGKIHRIASAFWHTVGGLREGLRTEAAIKQEFAVACIALPLSFFIAQNLWTWVALVASLLLVLSVEFLNTAIERLCDHIQPEKHDAIRITKDLGSAAVFFSLALAGLIWIAAVIARFGS
jgi:diacylglycerol kinase (ATP)